MAKTLKTTITLNGKVDKSLKAALKAAQSDSAKVADTIGNTFKKAAAVASAAFAAIKIGDVVGDAINIGKEFSQSMSQVQATMLIDKSTEEGRKAFQTLEDAARKCGRETAFSASEAAEGLNYLALAGYSAEQAAEALPTVLRLAGAGAMELADASDMVTDAMSALNIEVTQNNLDSFADKLAMTASKSNTSVQQLGEAILAVGGTASNLAGGTTELNTALGILADNGIKGAEGGTHLRNMLLSLQNPRNGDAAKLMNDWKISAYDANGEMKSLGDTFQDINTIMTGMSSQEKNDFISTIFKQTDLASARAMLAATTNDAVNLLWLIDDSIAETSQNGQKNLLDLGLKFEDLQAAYKTAGDQDAFIASMEKAGMTAETAKMAYSGLQNMLDGTGNRFEQLTGYINDSSGACQDMYDIQLDNLEGDMKKLGSAMDDLKISFFKSIEQPLRTGAQLVTNIASKIGSELDGISFDGLAAGIDTAAQSINSLYDKVSNGASFSEALSQVFSEDLQIDMPPALTSFVSGVETIASKAKETWSDFGSWIKTQVDSVGSVLSEHQGVVDSVMQLVIDLQDKFSTVVSFALDSTDLSGFVDVALSALQVITDIADSFVKWDGFVPTLIAIGSAFAAIKIVEFGSNVISTVSSVAQLVTSMATLQAAKLADEAETLALQALYAKDAIVKGASTAATVAQTAATTAWNVVCGAATAVTTALGAAFTFLTSPIGLVVVAIAAVIAIGVLLYKNWDTIKAKAAEIGAAIGEKFNQMKEAVGNAIAGFAERFPTVFAVISGYFNTLKDTVMNVVNGIKTTFGGIVDFFKGIFTGNMEQALGGLKNVFSGLAQIATAQFRAIADNASKVFTAIANSPFGQAIAEKFTQIKETVGNIVAGFADRFPEAFAVISGYFNTLKDTVMNVVEGIKTTFSGVVDIFKGLFSGNMDQAFGGLKKVFSGIAQIATAQFRAIYTNAIKVFQQLANTPAGKAIGRVFETVKNTAMNVFNGIKTFVTDAINGVVTTVTSIPENIGNAFNMVGEVINNAFNVIASSPLFTGITGLISNVQAGFQGFVSFISSNFLAPIQTALDSVLNLPFFSEIKIAVETVQKVFEGLTSFISNVFKGNWEAAWNDIVGVFKTIFEGLKDIVRSVLQKCVSPINSLIRGVNNISSSVGIPSIPEITIPAFATGGTVSAPTIALVGEGGAKETIIPHTNTPRSRELLNEATRGVYGSNVTTNKGGNTYNITYAPVINGGGDIKKQLKDGFEEFKEYFDRMNQEEDREVFA